MWLSRWQSLSGWLGWLVSHKVLGLILVAEVGSLSPWLVTVEVPCWLAVLPELLFKCWFNFWEIMTKVEDCAFLLAISDRSSPTALLPQQFKIVSQYFCNGLRDQSLVVLNEELRHPQLINWFVNSYRGRYHPNQLVLMLGNLFVHKLVLLKMSVVMDVISGAMCVCSGNINQRIDEGFKCLKEINKAIFALQVRVVRSWKCIALQFTLFAIFFRPRATHYFEAKLVEPACMFATYASAWREWNHLINVTPNASGRWSMGHPSHPCTQVPLRGTKGCRDKPILYSGGGRIIGPWQRCTCFCSTRHSRRHQLLTF